MGGGRQARTLLACALPMCYEGGRSSHEQRQCCARLTLAVIDKENDGRRTRGRERETMSNSERRWLQKRDNESNRGSDALRQQGDAGRVPA